MNSYPWNAKRYSVFACNHGRQLDFPIVPGLGDGMALADAISCTGHDRTTRGIPDDLYRCDTKSFTGKPDFRFLEWDSICFVKWRVPMVRLAIWPSFLDFEAEI